MEVTPISTSDDQNESDATLIGCNYIEARIREVEEQVTILARVILKEAELLPGLFEALEISGGHQQRTSLKDSVQDLRASIDFISSVPGERNIKNSQERVVYRRFKYLDQNILKLLETHRGSLSAAAIRKILINESGNKSGITAARIWNSLNRLVESGSIYKDGISFGVNSRSTSPENTPSSLVQPPSDVD